MTRDQVMVKMTLDRWYALIKNFETFLGEMTDEKLQHEVAPGRNRAIYLLGHLIAVHDDMFVKLDFGDKLYPELAGPFVESPDKAVAELPPAQELRFCWSKVNELLTEKINSLQPEQWFEKHTAVSAEDFAKEPHRNKLNIMITRTSHLSYHLGQLVLIK